MDEYISKQTFKEKYLCCGWLPEMSEEEFDAFPAADVAPVVHARWETNEVTGEIYCSNCLENAVFTSGHHYHCGLYCPCCGAKMDGGKNNKN